MMVKYKYLNVHLRTHHNGGSILMHITHNMHKVP